MALPKSQIFISASQTTHHSPLSAREKKLDLVQCHEDVVWLQICVDDLADRNRKMKYSTALLPFPAFAARSARSPNIICLANAATKLMCTWILGKPEAQSNRCS